MNILQVVSRLDGRDEARDLIQSTRFLTLSGHKVVVASEKSASCREIDEVGARHYTVNIRPNVFSIPGAVFKLSRIIFKENIDVVHARDGVSSFAAFFSARFKGRAFVATIYEHDRKRFFSKAQVWAKRVICFTESQARELTENGLVPGGRVRVIPPFAPPATDITTPPGESNNDFIIRADLPLFSKETTQNFVRAISILSRTIPRVKVFVSYRTPPGEKDAHEKLKLLIKRHSLGGVVTFLPRKDTEDKLPAPSLFLQVSMDKGPFSARPILEAASRGIAVAATPSGWIDDYARDSQSTFPVRLPGDPQGIASGIVNLYRNGRMREDAALSAKNFVKEKFDIKKIMRSTVDVYTDSVASTNILFIKIGALGDVILAVPSVRAVRKKFPQAKIKLLIGIEHREVFMNSPLVNELIICDFKGRDRGLAGLLRIGRNLRSQDLDMVLDLQNNKKSHILSFLSCAPKRYGYDNGKLGFLLNRKIKDPGTPIDPIEHQSKVLGLLGIYNVEKDLELWPSKEDEEWAESFLRSHWVKKNTKLVCLNIGSSRRWVTKLWPVEYFSEVTNRLARDHDVRIVLIGAEKRNERIKEFLKRAKSKPIDALGKTSIPRLASLVKRCNVLLSSDSAPVHVAHAVNTAFVALFGPTDPARHVVPAENSVVFKKNLKCSPCYSTYCKKGYACMNSIKPGEVREAIVKLLGF